MTTQGPDDPTPAQGEGDTSRFEYLPEEESAPPARRSGRKRAMAGVGALALVALAGAGAYGLMQFMSSGDSPATAVPDTALGYLSLDLDPAGGQKLAAYETMRKFPALKEQLGLQSDDDPRRWIVDAINNNTECGLDFEDDVAPWLGHKVAVSAVDAEETPEPFFVLEVTDADAAEDGIATLFECGGEEEEEYGTAMVGDFMVVAPRAELAEDIAADAEESPLSDDETFGARMDDAGDEGVMTGYLAPGAVELMLAEAEQMEGSAGTTLEPTDVGDGDELAGGVVPPVGPQVDLLRDHLADFEGAAMQVRFADEGVEMEMVAAGIRQLEDLEPGSPGMADLPGTTAIAYGFGASGEAVGMIEETVKGQMSDAEYESEVQRFEQQTGLTFPEDVETLLGDGLSLAVDGSIDVEALGEAFMGGDLAGVELPVGVRIVTDDTDAVLEVTDKLQALIPPGMPLTMEVEGGDGTVAVGVDPAYVEQLAGDGNLGDSVAFEDAVPDADDSLGGMYVDFDAEGWLTELVGQEDPQTLANVEPLSAMGMSTWADDDTGRMLLRLTTD